MRPFQIHYELIFKYLNETLNINAIVFSHFRIKWFRKIKRDLWVVERLAFDSFLNLFEFYKLNDVQLKDQPTTSTSHMTTWKICFRGSFWSLTESNFEARETDCMIILHEYQHFCRKFSGSFWNLWNRRVLVQNDDGIQWQTRNVFSYGLTQIDVENFLVAT